MQKKILIFAKKIIRFAKFVREISCKNVIFLVKCRLRPMKLYKYPINFGSFQFVCFSYEIPSNLSRKNLQISSNFSWQINELVYFLFYLSLNVNYGFKIDFRFVVTHVYYINNNKMKLNVMNERLTYVNFLQ